MLKQKKHSDEFRREALELKRAPAVTVTIAAYDRLEFLREAIQSATAQSYRPLEILVVNDGSGPDVRNWLDIMATKESLLRVIHLPHSGVATARKATLEAADGDLVCVLDSDDWFVPDAIERLVTVFLDDGSVDLAYCNNIHVYPDGSKRHRTYPAYCRNEDMVNAIFIRPVVPFKHSGTMFRRDVALELGGYDPSLPVKVDVDLFLRFLNAGKRLHLVEEPLVHFRLHGGSISHRNRIEGIRVWRQLIDRYAGHRPAHIRYLLRSMRGLMELGKLVYAGIFLRQVH